VFARQIKDLTTLLGKTKLRKTKLGETNNPTIVVSLFGFFLFFLKINFKFCVLFRKNKGHKARFSFFSPD
jgi:hypothetical protein